MIFLFIRLINKLRSLRAKEEAVEEAAEAAAEPEPSKEELLLTEIRDLLRQRKG